MRLENIKVGRRTLKIKNCVGLHSIRGLMFDNMKNFDGALIYANNIWMPFVKHKLNLVFLDEKMKVTKTVLAVPMTCDTKTWKTYKDEDAEYCLELKDTKIRIGKGTKLKLKI
jgi:uncharacterized membrane protein (UPF0127 family)